MRFRVEHESLYRYDVPIQLGAHVLRLTPRGTGTRLLTRRLVVEPQPTSWSEELDSHGNPYTRVEFSGATQSLLVRSEFELETLVPPELGPGLAALPYAQPDFDDLIAYRGASCHPSVKQFSDSLLRDARFDPVSFLDHVTRALYTRIDRHIRPSGDARLAHETLALGSGACRDLTVLFLEVCRCQGMAARFVSGYQAQAQTPDGQRHLHAWAEVFLPGASWRPGPGWRAWDPTHGVRVTDGHVALCAAPHQSGTMPIEGGFFFQGSTVNSTLDHSVRIGTS